LIVAQINWLIVVQINWLIVAFWLLLEAPLFGLVVEAPTSPNKWIQIFVMATTSPQVVCWTGRMMLYKLSVELSWVVVLSPSLLCLSSKSRKVGSVKLSRS
jgi:hypothetical protein